MSAQERFILKGIIVDESNGKPISGATLYLGRYFPQLDAEENGSYTIKTDSLIYNTRKVKFAAPQYSDTLIQLKELDTIVKLKRDYGGSGEVEYVFNRPPEEEITINDMTNSSLVHITSYTLKRICARYFPYMEKYSSYYISKVIVYCQTDGKSYPFDLNIFSFDTLTGYPGEKIIPTIEAYTSSEYDTTIFTNRGQYERAWIAEIDLTEFKLKFPKEGIYISPAAQFWKKDIANSKIWPNDRFEDYYPCFWNHWDKQDDVYQWHIYSKGWKKRNKRYSPNMSDEYPPFVNLAISLVLVRKGKLQLY